VSPVALTTNSPFGPLAGGSRLNAPRRILLVPGTLDGRNFGDASAAIVALRRLRSLWPASEVGILAERPEAMTALLPGTIPVSVDGLRARLADWGLSGYGGGTTSMGFLARTVARKLRLSEGTRDVVGQRFGSLLGAGGESFRRFRGELERFELIVFSGAVGFSDRFPVGSRLLLELVAMAAESRIPYVFFSHTFGPCDRPFLASRAGQAVRGAAFVAVRDPATTPGFLRRWGIGTDGIPVTGDDAVELAFESAPEELGNAVGLNLRVANYAGSGGSLVELLAPVVREFVRSQRTVLVPLPIAFHDGADDVGRLTEAFRHCGLAAWAPPRSPEALLADVGRCRVVVTGAYHAAVFALSEGIPTVCLTRSAFYDEKFSGLRQLFGDGCLIVNVRRDEDVAGVGALLEEMWRGADELRARLLEAAANQVTLSRAAWSAMANSWSR